MENKTKPFFYRPLRTNYLTQGFNESKACAKTNISGQMIRPPKVVGTHTGICPAGYKNLYHLMGMKNHNGEDYLAWLAEPLYHGANFDGWMKTERDSAGGIGVDVVSNEPLLYCEECKQYHYVKARYWHLQDTIGYDGRKIKMGDVIGLAGSTGASSGVHLHLGYKWCDKQGRGIHKNNGFYGAMEIPMIQDVYVRDVVGIKDKLNTIQFTRMSLLQIQQFIKKFIN